MTQSYTKKLEIIKNCIVKVKNKTNKFLIKIELFFFCINVLVLAVKEN